MPFVNIRIVKEVIASDPGVVFEQVAARDWYVGPTSVESLRKGAR